MVTSRNTSRYTHRILLRGGLCSEHTSKALAEKARRRLVAMSNGKLTAADFPIEEIALTGQSENGAKLIADFADRYLSHGGKLTMADVIDCACDDREITDEQEAFLLAHFEAHPVKAPDHWKARR